MNILAITIESWQLAGVSVGVVFGILVALVFILEIFTLVAKKSESRASAVKKTSTQNAQEKSLADASEKDKAAVAMALYLYTEEELSTEISVLTITYHEHAWSAELNPRL